MDFTEKFDKAAEKKVVIYSSFSFDSVFLFYGLRFS